MPHNLVLTLLSLALVTLAFIVAYPRFAVVVPS